MPSLSDYDNVYMKISGLSHFADDPPLYESVKPFTRWFVDAFGPDNMVWGSGNLQFVDTLLANYSETDRMKVKEGNLRELVGGE